MKAMVLALILALSAGCCGMATDVTEAPAVPSPADDQVPAAFYLDMYDSEDPVNFGDSTIYYFEVINQGPPSAAKVTFTVPDGAIFSSASEGYLLNGGEVSWNVQLATDERFDGWVGIEVRGAASIEGVLTVQSGDYSQSVSETTSLYG